MRVARRRSKQILVKTDLEPQPVMVVCGPERALVQAAVRHLRSAVVSGAMADFNHDRLQGKGLSVEQALACARTLPVMAPQRLVEINDAEALGAESLEKIAKYAREPCAESVLLLVASDVDGRTRAAKAFRELGCMYRYEHLDEPGLARYARDRARAIGLKLDEEAAVTLVAAVGTELLLVERALEKLELVSGAGEVRLADIEEHISQTRVESIFKLTEAIGNGKAGAALEVLGQMLDAREAPLRILATLAWQQRQLMRARGLLDEGMPGGEVARAVKVFRFADRFLSQVRSMPAARVRAGLLVLASADRRLKSSRVPARAVMERTVIELTQLR